MELLQNEEGKWYEPFSFELLFKTEEERELFQKYIEEHQGDIAKYIDLRRTK